MSKNCYVYEIEYTYKSGYRNKHKILSKIDNSDKFENVIKTQLEKSNKARFRVVLGDENKLRITSGWLFRMDLRSYSLKPLGRF